MGLKDCFDGGKADFSKMAGGADNIYVSDVLHKTFISVDTQGTKAGAVTKVEMKALSMVQNPHTITLNRPFVYAIVDNDTNLPLFIGMMMNPEE
jgi:serpin B